MKYTKEFLFHNFSKSAYYPSQNGVNTTVLNFDLGGTFLERAYQDPNNGLLDELQINKIKRIDDALYACGFYGFYKKVDGQGNWSLLKTEDQIYTDLIDFNGNIYVSTYTDYIKVYDKDLGTWSDLNTGIPQKIYCFEQANDPSFIWVGTESGLYTIDTANSATLIDFASETVTSIYRSTTHVGLVVVTTDANTYATLDNGDSGWNIIAIGSAKQVSEQGDYLYISTPDSIKRVLWNEYVGSGGYVISTLNNGLPLGNTLIYFTFWINGTLYASVEANGIYRSTDNGATFTQYKYDYRETIFPDVISYFYDSANRLLYTTNFNQASHYLVSLFSVLQDTLIEEPTTTSFELKANYAGLSDLLYVSEMTSTALVGVSLSGQNCFYTKTTLANAWNKPSNTGLTHNIVLSLFESGSNLYVGTLNGGIYKSTDAGENWTNYYDSGVSERNVRKIYAHTPIAADAFVLLTDSGAYSCLDSNLADWTLIGLSGIKCLSAYSNATVALIGTEANGLYYHTGASTFTQIPSIPTSSTVKSIKLIGSNYYVATTVGLYYCATINGTYTLITDVPVSFSDAIYNDIGFTPQTAKYVVATNEGILESTDGLTFVDSALNNGLLLYPEKIFSDATYFKLFGYFNYTLDYNPIEIEYEPIFTKAVLDGREFFRGRNIGAYSLTSYLFDSGTKTVTLTNTPTSKINKIYEDEAFVIFSYEYYGDFATSNNSKSPSSISMSDVSVFSMFLVQKADLTVQETDGTYTAKASAIKYITTTASDLDGSMRYGRLLTVHPVKDAEYLIFNCFFRSPDDTKLRVLIVEFDSYLYDSIVANSEDVNYKNITPTNTYWYQSSYEFSPSHNMAMRKIKSNTRTDQYDYAYQLIAEGNIFLVTHIPNYAELNIIPIERALHKEYAYDNLSDTSYPEMIDFVCGDTVFIKAETDFILKSQMVIKPSSENQGVYFDSAVKNIVYDSMVYPYDDYLALNSDSSFVPIREYEGHATALNTEFAVLYNKKGSSMFLTAIDCTNPSKPSEARNHTYNCVSMDDVSMSKIDKVMTYLHDNYYFFDGSFGLTKPSAKLIITTITPETEVKYEYRGNAYLVSSDTEKTTEITFNKYRFGNFDGFTIKIYKNGIEQNILTIADLLASNTVKDVRVQLMNNTVQVK